VISHCCWTMIRHPNNLFICLGFVIKCFLLFNFSILFMNLKNFEFLFHFDYLLGFFKNFLLIWFCKFHCLISRLDNWNYFKVISCLKVYFWQHKLLIIYLFLHLTVYLYFKPLKYFCFLLRNYLIIHSFINFLYQVIKDIFNLRFNLHFLNLH
jgi:hypothetical protein